MMRLPKLLPENLAHLSLPQILLVKRSLEKFFYSTGINIALYSAIKSEKGRRFQEKATKALKKQIYHMAQMDRIDRITKQVLRKRTDPSVEHEVFLSWLPFSESFDGGTTALLAFLLWAAAEGGQTGLDKMVPQHRFNLTNLEIRNQIALRAEALPSMLDKTGVAWVAKTISEGLNQGMSATGIAGYLRSKAAEISEERGKLIVETELMTAMNLVETETFRRNGIEFVKWITAEDERVCILGGRTKIKTLEDYKEIRNIKVGDYVLTHKDRYKKVTKTFKRKYYGEVVRIVLSALKDRNSIQLTVTKNHKILVRRNNRKKWIIAWNLKNDDLVYVEGKKCDCKKIIPFYYSRCFSCKTKEINKRRWMREGEKEKLKYFNIKYGKVKLMRKVFKEKWKDPEFRQNLIDKMSNTKKEQWMYNPELRKKAIELGKKWFATDPNHPLKLITKEQRLKGLKNALTNRGRNHLGNSYLEKKMKWFLEKESIKFTPQWFYRYKDGNDWKYAWADFMLPTINTVIECDGFFHEKLRTKQRDKIKDNYLVEKGFNILRFDKEEIRNNFDKVASMIKGLNCITTIPIKKLIKWHLKSRIKDNPCQTVYNLEVEEDQSYTANGMIVHNCEQFCAPNEVAGTVKLGDEFSSGG